jgi:hypothetical protein
MMPGRGGARSPATQDHIASSTSRYEIKGGRAGEPIDLMTANKNRPWSEDDDRRLLELKAAGRSAVSISAALKRSASAIQGRTSLIRARERIAGKEGRETSRSPARSVNCEEL